MSEYGSPGPGPDFPTGNIDGDRDGDMDYAGRPGGGSDVQTGNVDDGMQGGADYGGSTNNEPRHPAER